MTDRLPLLSRVKDKQDAETSKSRDITSFIVFLHYNFYRMSQVYIGQSDWIFFISIDNLHQIWVRGRLRRQRYWQKLPVRFRFSFAYISAYANVHVLTFGVKGFDGNEEY